MCGLCKLKRSYTRCLSCAVSEIYVTLARGIDGINIELISSHCALICRLFGNGGCHVPKFLTNFHLGEINSQVFSIYVQRKRSIDAPWWGHDFFLSRIYGYLCSSLKVKSYLVEVSMKFSSFIE